MIILGGFDLFLTILVLMRNVWFTADTHFGHKKIPFYAKRKFCLDDNESEKLDAIWQNKNFYNDWSPSWNSIARMNDHLIKQINDNVGKDDILWHLGDFCFGKKNQYVEAKKYRDKINCSNIFLVMGNHDRSEIKSLFSGCYDYHELIIHNKRIVLSHYSHSFWNKSHAKSWMLYGHAHGTAEEWLDLHMPGRLSMDVGVDNAFRIFGEYRPISLKEIGRIFEPRNGFNIDGNKVRSVALQPKKCD